MSPYYPLYAIYEPLNNGNELDDGTQITIPKGESVIIAIGPRLLMDYAKHYLSNAKFEAEVNYLNYVFRGDLEEVRFVNLDSFRSMDGYLRIEPISSLLGRSPYLESLILFINGRPKLAYTFLPPEKYLKVKLPIGKSVNLALYSVRAWTD